MVSLDSFLESLGNCTWSGSSSALHPEPLIHHLSNSCPTDHSLYCPCPIWPDCQQLLQERPQRRTPAKTGPSVHPNIPFTSLLWLPNTWCCTTGLKSTLLDITYQQSSEDVWPSQPQHCWKRGTGSPGRFRWSFSFRPSSLGLQMDLLLDDGDACFGVQWQVALIPSCFLDVAVWVTVRSNTKGRC